MGKYNQRTPGKTPKTPQSRGHPSFCLWNIDYVKSKSWVSFSREDKSPLHRSLPSKNFPFLYQTSIQIEPQLNSLI